jgi:RNA polymerase sigma factor (sigma-70 family)
MRSDLGATETATADLVTLMQGGDRAAFEELLRLEVGRLVRLASAITGNEADAYDVLQETLTIAWRRSSTLRDHDRFPGWLTKILINESRHVIRRRARNSVAEATLIHRSPIPLPTSTVEDSVADQDRLERAFERLTPRHRALLALHHLEQQSINDIGYALGLRPGTVKSQLFSARKALADALSEEDRDAP